MKRRISIRPHPRRATAAGQSLVEFTLVITLLMVILMGIFDLGMGVFSYNILSNAAREGARTGIIIEMTDDDIRARVRQASAGIALTNGQIRIQPSPRVYGQPITVTVTYTYTALTPVLGQMVAGGGLRMQATSVMIVEGVIEY